MDDDLVYKKPRKPLMGDLDAGLLESSDRKDSLLPTLAQAQEKQQNALLEIAQVRYGVKGRPLDTVLMPLKIDLSMGEAQIFKLLLTAPESERADQVLYALAKGNLQAPMANQILASLAILDRFKKIKID